MDPHNKFVQLNIVTLLNEQILKTILDEKNKIKMDAFFVCRRLDDYFFCDSWELKDMSLVAKEIAKKTLMKPPL